jgi:hypothetical protein
MRLDIKNNPYLRMKQIVNNDTAIKNLLTSTPEQIENYIDTNVNTLNDVRFVLKKILKLIVILIKLRLVKDENNAR